MNSTLVKIISGILAVFILIYVGVQVYNNIYSPYKTETVFESVVADSVEATGIVFRDEVVVKAKKSANGIISYYYPNGSKVAKNSEIAEVYENAEDLEKNYRIEQLTNEISILKECQVQNSGVAQNDTLNKQLNQQHLSLIDKINNHNLSAIADNKYEILKVLNNMQLITGKLKSLKPRISKLTNERNKLKSSLSNCNKTIKASASGLFADQVNGYEDQSGFSNANNLNDKLFNSFLNAQKKTPEDAVGKIITSYEWRFAVRVNKSEAVKFTEGQLVTSTFSSFADESVQQTVEKIFEDVSSNQVIVVLKSDLIDENIVTLRSDKVKISFNNSKGLKVSKKALYINNGVKGVYTLLGNEVIFKKVDIVFETDEYFLSKQHSDDSDYLKIYDDVIIKGKDLYDKQKGI